MTTDNGNDQKWKGSRGRDDTPSFIRNVESRSSMLNPGRNSSDYIPVLSVPTSVKVWAKIRWPLAVVTVVLVLAFVGFFTNDILVSKNVELRIEDSFIGEKTAHVQVLFESNRVLHTLSKKYPKRINVQAAYAWNTVLLVKLFGDRDGLIKNAEAAFEAIDDDTSSIGIAAKAAKRVLDGKLEEGETVVNKGLLAFGNEPRIHLAEAWLKLAKGNTKAGVEKLEGIRSQFPEYLPPLFELIDVSIKNGDNLAIATHSSELLTASTGNLYGAVASLLVRLPGWNKDPLSSEDLEELISVQKELRRQVKKAPQKLQVYTQFIEGRLEAERGNYARAIEVFQPMLSDPQKLNVLAWYGKAMMEQDGPRAALAAIESAGTNPPFEIHDLRARAYLALYKVAEAEESIFALTGKVDYDLNELKWILAVRKGDVEKAKAKLPPSISRRLQYDALEMYELLQKVGDKEGIEKLTDAMSEGGLVDCAAAIGHWHNNRLLKILHQFRTSEDSCVVTLSVRLMKDNFDPQTLVEIANRLPKSNSLVRTNIDKTVITWKTDGYAKALAALDAIAEQKYQSGPLVTALAEAYFRMEQYKKVVQVTAGTHYPEALALRYKSFVSMQRKKDALKLLLNAARNKSVNGHPAIVTLLLSQTKDTGAIGEVIEGVEKAIDGAGVWTSELAELKALSMSAMGERGDADRFMTGLIKPAGRAGGLAESWEVQKAIIRINLRRGGNFLFKAVSYTVDLYKSKVEDAEVIYSYGIESQRQGNERGAVRYFNDAIELDPTYVAAYQQLSVMNELTEELKLSLAKYRPYVKL